MSSERSGEPGNVDGLNAAGSGKRTPGECDAVRKKLAQETQDMSLAPAMDRSRRRTHKDVAMLVTFNTMREFGECGLVSISAQRARLNSV